MSSSWRAVRARILTPDRRPRARQAPHPQLSSIGVGLARARLRGMATPHTETATRVLCARSVPEAAERGGTAAAEPRPDGDMPRHEIWGRRIQAAFRH